MSEVKLAAGTPVPIEISEYKGDTVYTAPARFTLAEDDNCVTALRLFAKEGPDSVLFIRPEGFDWVNVTAREFVNEVNDVAKGLIAAGIEEGDRIVLLSETRYEWNLIDFAIWCAGGVVVPVYPSSSTSQIQWIVEDSGAVLAITETREHTDKFEHLLLQEDGTPKLSGSPSKLRQVLEINSDAVKTLKFNGRAVDIAEVDRRVAAIKQHAVSSINYTSGTTGRPKGCELTHYNWIFEVRSLMHDGVAALARPGRRTVTYLPLAHVLSRAVTLAVIVGGATQAHWSDTNTLTTAFGRFRPELILGVPRVYEKVRNSAYNQAAAKGPVGAEIFRRAERVAIDYSKALDTPEGPSTRLKFEHKLFDRLVYSKLKSALGGEVGEAITGGSAINSELLHFFRGVGVPVYEGYGLTETSAACAVNFEDSRIGSIGQPLNGFAARVNKEGELCIKGGGVFAGYWNNPEATAEALDDGWFRTGDLGRISETGHIYITGRQKDLIVTAGGKNISPAPMEEILREHPLISQALIVGDGKPFPGLLVTLDDEEFERWKKENNIPASKTVKELAAGRELQAEIHNAINRVNATVSKSEGIKKFRILDRDLTEGEGELTPTMKVKRNVVFETYAKEIDKLYGIR